MAEQTLVARVTDKEILTIRTIDFPRKVVWQAWTDPQQLKQWWGPMGFTNTFKEFDPQPGGSWRFIMHGPNGADYSNESIFVEVVKPERIVLDHISGPEFRLTGEFADVGGKTRISFRQSFDKASECDKVKGFAPQCNEQNLDKLEMLLARAKGESDFVLSRIFNAPPKLVFEACTQEKQLKQWWGPKGFEWVSSRLDLRPEGEFVYCMRSPDGHDMWGKFTYKEVAAPGRLVFTNSFADEKGNAVRAPFAADWPLQVLNTWTFTERSDGTTATLRGVPFNANEQERKTFENARNSLEQGFGGTLDQLEEYLRSLN